MSERNYTAGTRLPPQCEVDGCDVKPHSRWKGGLALCPRHWRNILRHGQFEVPEKVAPAPIPPCTVDGCSSISRSRNAGLCEVHYMRKRRHGATDFKTTLISGPLKHSGGYLLDHLPEHPLRKGRSRVYQHRAVFYDSHGAGPFSCHWCEKVVTWDDMHVDHLDDVKTNNDPSNLVASCPICNQDRGRHKMILKQKMKGTLITAFGVTMCKKDWATRLGLSPQTIANRLAKGDSEEEALRPRAGTGPVSKKKPRPGFGMDLTPHHNSEAQARDKERSRT